MIINFLMKMSQNSTMYAAAILAIATVISFKVTFHIIASLYDLLLLFHADTRPVGFYQSARVELLGVLG